MRLRTNQVLKIFALLLFSLEFLSPAFLVDFSEQSGRPDKVQLLDGTHHQNILYSIFSEEITESEEGREGQKDSVAFTLFGFGSTLLQLVGGKSACNKYTPLALQQFDTHPALFKLNCSFLI